MPLDPRQGTSREYVPLILNATKILDSFQDEFIGVAGHEMPGISHRYTITPLIADGVFWLNARYIPGADCYGTQEIRHRRRYAFTTFLHQSSSTNLHRAVMISASLQARLYAMAIEQRTYSLAVRNFKVVLLVGEWHSDERNMPQVSSYSSSKAICLPLLYHP